MNKLYYGDCLTIMSDLPAWSVDLIYLDPPFNSNRQYTAIYKDETGRPLPDQIEAFCDMWELDTERERVIQTMPVLMRESGIDDSAAQLWRLWMHSLRNTQPRLLAYLTYMTQRLLVMKRLLKPTGSLYLHCDPTASHYIKALMDAIFGHQNFRNEVVWRRTSAHSGAKRWGPIHDTLLFYSGGDKYTWNRILQPYAPEYAEEEYGYQDEQSRRWASKDLTGSGTRQGDSGNPWRGVDPNSVGRHWAVPRQGLPPWFEKPDGFNEMTVQDRLDALDDADLIYWPPRGKVPRFKRYLRDSDGVAIQDLILDIKPVSGDEDMDYDTQKPVALLERIIQASSNQGDLVLDPFCGCATTLEAAQKLGRRWIGIDIAIHAVKRVASRRLVERLGLVQGEDFEIEGVPRNLEGAQDLWERDKYQFQKWAVEQVDGFVTNRKSADGGIDGRLYFEVGYDVPLESMVLEVKGGRVNIKDLRALRGVLSNNDAVMAGLITMEPLPPRQRRNFDQEMAKAGLLNIAGIGYDKLQVLSAAEILEGKRFKTPVVVGHRQVEPQMPGLPAPTG